MEKVPIFELKDPERIWLSKVYEIVKMNKKPNSRRIWSVLHNILPFDFHPATINSNLINSSGEEITLLGIVAIEKSHEIIEKADKVIFLIKDRILNDPELKNISILEIADELGLSFEQVGIIVFLSSRYGYFYQGSTNTEDGIRIKEIDLGNDNRCFNQYLYFNGFENLILRFLKDEENSNKSLKDFRAIESLPEKKSRNARHPIFKNNITEVDKKLCFVLMPFREHWSDTVYKYYLRNNVESLGLQCLRADNLLGPIIIEDIWTKINQAAFIIADVTTTNPNVMYELGMAHTLGKPVVLITQDVDRIPFDHKHLRHHSYSVDVDGSNEFRDKIKIVIKDLYDEHYPMVLQS